MMMPSAMAFAQEAVAEAQGSGVGVMETIGAVLSGIAVLAVVVAIIGHMIYDNFIRKDFRIDYTANEFHQQRKDEALGDMTSQQAQAIDNNLDQMLSLWGELPAEDGEMVPYPLSHSAVKKSIAIITEAVAQKPTDRRIVERINGANEILNHALKRQFNGSKTMIITAVIIGVIMSAISGTPMAMVSIIIGVALYILASRSTNFFIGAKQAKGGGGKSSFLSGIIGGLFMGVAAAKSYKVVTTYSDGSTSTDTDHSETWFSLIFALVVMVTLSFMLSLIALINYLRNYIIYY